MCRHRLHYKFNSFSAALRGLILLYSDLFAFFFFLPHIFHEASWSSQGEGFQLGEKACKVFLLCKQLAQSLMKPSRVKLMIVGELRNAEKKPNQPQTAPVPAGWVRWRMLVELAPYHNSTWGFHSLRSCICGYFRLTHEQNYSLRHESFSRFSNFFFLSTFSMSLLSSSHHSERI